MAILTVEVFKQLFDVDRIQQLASDMSQQFGTVKYNEAIVQTIITQAEGVVKNTLGLPYTEAQLEGNTGIVRIVADIAMFYLESRRPPIAAETTQLYKLALHMLEQLQKGEAKLEATDQLLPIGNEVIPTEAIQTGFFNLTDEEQDSLL